MKVRTLAMSAGIVMITSAAMAEPQPIASGVYHCKAGSSRMMLTLGDIQISGMSYVFRDPTGGSTSGSYSIEDDGYHWSGDIGAITNDQIVDSGPGGSPNVFFFRYKGRPTSLPTTASCEQ